MIAKRYDSKYEPGKRSGAWKKICANQGQEFVIGGYTPSLKNLDALVIGYYDGPKLIYAVKRNQGRNARVRTLFLFPENLRVR